MEIRDCPACGSPIPVDGAEFSRQEASCRECGAVHRLSELVGFVPYDDVAEDSPPPGCRVTRTADGVRVEVSLRSARRASIVGAGCLFWNAVVSFPLRHALAAVLHHIGATPGSTAPLLNGAPMTVWDTVWFSAFIGLFQLFGIGLLVAVLVYTFGTVEVRVGRDDCELFRGIGSIGPRTRFRRDEIKMVGERRGDPNGEHDGESRIAVILRSGRVIEFGSDLTEERRHWLAGVLRERLTR